MTRRPNIPAAPWAKRDFPRAPLRQPWGRSAALAYKGPQWLALFPTNDFVPNDAGEEVFTEEGWQEQSCYRRPRRAFRPDQTFFAARSTDAQTPTDIGLLGL